MSKCTKQTILLYFVPTMLVSHITWPNSGVETYHRKCLCVAAPMPYIKVAVVYWYLKGYVTFTNIHTFCFDACAMMHGNLDLVFTSCVVILPFDSGLLRCTIVILVIFDTQFEPTTIQ